MKIESSSPVRTASPRRDEPVVSAVLPVSRRQSRIDLPVGAAAWRAGGLGATLRRISERLGPHEIRRRMVHITPGFLPFLLWPIPHEDPLSDTLRNVMIGIAVCVSGWAWVKRSSYVRRGEQTLTSSVFGYAAVVLGMLILIPSAPELGLAVMGIIAFGDGSATLAGLIVGGRKLPWNKAKSWAGFVAFLGVSIPMATLIFAGEAQPGVSGLVAFACVAPAAFVAALAESLPSRINDNIRVGVAAAMTILPLHGMFCGW
jgi:dolichol kinase